MYKSISSGPEGRSTTVTVEDDGSVEIEVLNGHPNHQKQTLKLSPIVAYRILLDILRAKQVLDSRNPQFADEEENDDDL